MTEESGGSFFVHDTSGLPKSKRRLRLGMVGGGRGGFIGGVHAMGARLSDRYEVVAGALSSDPKVAKESGADWYLDPDRAYTSYREMATAEAARPEGIDAVAVTTPNNVHHDCCAAFLDAGIDVICDKPLTTTLDDALDLVRRVRETGLIFGVTYSFASYPMVRQAREMIAAGEIGSVRQIHTEFFAEWFTADIIATNKQAAWRSDPARSGPAFCTADIGTHAHHMGRYVSGLEMTQVRAEVMRTGVAEMELDDTVYAMARYGEVPGTLLATMVAPGNPGGLRFRIIGDKASVAWDHENPEYLVYSRFGEPKQIISRGGGAGVGALAARGTRTPRGHSEGWIEAWANLYGEVAIAIEARRDGIAIEAGALEYPTVEDGARGVKWVEAALESSRAGGEWRDCSLSLR